MRLMMILLLAFVVLPGCVDTPAETKDVVTGRYPESEVESLGTNSAIIRRPNGEIRYVSVRESGNVYEDRLVFPGREE